MFVLVLFGTLNLSALKKRDFFSMGLTWLNKGFIMIMIIIM